MKLIDLLDQDDITLNVPFTSKKRLFELLADKLGDDDKMSMAIYNALVQREKLGNTSLGNGIAFPHGKCLADREIRIHLVKLKQEVNFENVDEVSVGVVVAAVFPKQTNKSHQEIMNDAVAFFRQHRLYKLILDATSKTQVLDNIMEYFQKCNS
ncbi:PTS sugar transporter subunit IIA [Marinicella sp. W31]|uniref:PTS sugar transporter subunit IIA n=1 Tax=Marinicella sp. W31 TaxID=3023713 RepID=UPI0037568D74